MLKLALPLAIAGIAVAAEPPKTYSGVVHDNSRVSSTPAQQCPLIKGPKYTLQTGDGAWILRDEKLAAPYAGRNVRVTGTISDGNKLHILSITPAKSSPANE